MAETPSHTWTCPSCGRRVPQRAEACHCGMTRERAGELAAVAAPTAPAPIQRARPARVRGPIDRHEAVAAMTNDVKALLVACVLVAMGGLVWLAFGPPPAPAPAVLGYVDGGPPPAPRPTPTPTPPIKLPWWK